MAFEHTRQSGLPRHLSTVIGDLADLIQKELHLARSEIVEKLNTKLHAGIWMVSAGVLGLISLMLLMQAAVFWVSSFGIEMYWACLIVAGGLAVIAAVAFFKGRSDAQEELTPTRTITQLKQDISIVKEQLS